MEPTMVNCRFPVEIMMKILSHLPIKSIVRFRCVCNSWFRLFTAQTSDPYFTQLHAAYSTLANPNPILIHLRTENRGVQLPTNFFFAPDYTQIGNPLELKEPDCYTDEIPSCWVDNRVCLKVHGICNGLVCLQSEYYYESDTMYIWNPITRDNSRIPCTPYLDDVSDERNKRTVYGFGFHQATNEYKVVGIIVSSWGKYAYECRANVLTLGTNTWRAMEDVLHDVNISSNMLPSNIFINEALHWLAYEGICLYGGRKLISFDLERELLQEIEMPKVLIGDDYLDLEEVSGMLAIIRNDYKNEVQIWVMNDYGVQDSWTKQFTITKSQIPVPNRNLVPFGVANDGNIMMRNGSYLLLLNPKTNFIRTSKFFSDSCPSAYFYKWSLVSPRYITSEGNEKERKTCT